MNNIVGPELLQNVETGVDDKKNKVFQSKTVSHEVLSNCKFVAIYFGAHWAPPCRLFTKTLTEFYNQTNEHDKKVEVVFVSIDGN